jgi:cytoskeletal protein CcmA (bactofilin family)
MLMAVLITVLLTETAAAVNADSAGNKFDISDSVIADQSVKGDYVAFGNTVKLESGVNGDIIAGGRILIITDDGAVQNIYAAGQNVAVRAKSARNIYAAGGDITINSGTAANGVYLVGGTVIFGGTATDVYIAAPAVTVDGTVYGNLTIRSDHIVFGKNTTVDGHVTIYGTVKPKLPPNISEAKLTFKRIIPSGKENMQEAGGISRLKVITAVVGVVTAVLLAVLLTLFRGGWLKGRANELDRRVWKLLLWGLLAFIVAPVGALICMLTVFALPVGVIAVLGYAVSLYLAPVITGAVLGRRFLPKLNRYLAASLGAAALELLLLVPYLKILLFLVCAFYTLGVTVICLKPHKENRGENHRTM